MGLDPVTLAIGSLAMSAVGTGVGVLGAINSSQAQAAEASYQSQVAKNNASIAEQNREYAARAGAVNAQQVSLANAEKYGQMRAAYGANNLDVNSGSPADVQQSQKEVGEYSTLNEIQKAALQQYGYQIAGTGYTSESELQAYKAAAAPTAGAIGATSSLLQGAGSIGGRYAWMQQTGLVGNNYGDWSPRGSV